MPSKIRLVTRRLLPRAAELRDLRARLVRAQDAVERWKQRFERRGADVDRLKASVDELKCRVRALARRADVRKHGELSSRVLAQLLAARAVERPLLAADVAAAEQRLQRLLETSTEYATAMHDATARVTPLERVQVDGLPWWVPRDEATMGRATRLSEQGFPLRAILQTREVALGGVMLDIGANIGRTSITRVLLGDVRAVYAAEPEPVNFACLVQNVVEHGLSGFVLPDRVAIGAERSEVRLQRSRYIGGHSVMKAGGRGTQDLQTVVVQLWPLDDWIVRVGADPRSVSFVKVDTQGFEPDVLLGARGLLARRHVAWQMEIDPGLLRRAGSSLPALLSLAAAHFTHFIDIGTRLPGTRVRSVAELAEALDYVGPLQSKTDVILYNAGS